MNPVSDARRAVLTSGTKEMGLSLDADQIDLLLRFLDVLSKWNRVYSLTAIEDGVDMVRRHLLDSLAMLPYIKGPRVLDLGTGAGLPGIPLAVAQRDWQFTLLDANRKKTRFVRQAVLELNLANVQVVNERAEDFNPSEPFDTVITRAVTAAAETLAWITPLLAPARGRLVLMKGAYPRAELAALPASARLEGVYPVRVPGLQAERHAVVIEAAPGAAH